MSCIWNVRIKAAAISPNYFIYNGTFPAGIVLKMWFTDSSGFLRQFQVSVRSNYFLNNAKMLFDFFLPVLIFALMLKGKGG